MAITILAMAAKISAMIVTFAHLIAVASALPAGASALENSISVLESAVTTLENSSGWWEKSLPWFTGLVVLGLIADLVVVVWERREEMTAWHRWVLVGIHFPDRPTTGRFILELLATAAIFLGVAGEFWAGVKIAYINGQLRSKNAELRRDSDQLVALVNERAGKLEKEAAEIEESVAPRRLTIAQRELLASHLRQFAGRSLTVFTDPSDAESAVFASELYLALKSAKWNVDGSRNVARGGQTSMTVAPSLPATGIDVPCGPPKLRDAAGRALVRELTTMGFDSQCSTRVTGLWPLEVLARPEGPQGEAKLRAEAKKKQQASTQVAAP
jgi:hypothetical protein